MLSSIHLKIPLSLLTIVKLLLHRTLKSDDHGFALVTEAFRAAEALTRILPALDADAKAVGRVWRPDHVDGSHHQVLVHVEIVVVLLRTACGAGHGAPPTTPRVVTHLVACTAAAPSPKVPQHLLG